MTEMLLDVEPVKPPWVLLMEKHGIETRYDDKNTNWEASWDQGHHTPIKQTGESERDAVVRLVHVAKLDGWQGVSA